jgi:hypothetical protein
MKRLIQSLLQSLCFIGLGAQQAAVAAQYVGVGVYALPESQASSTVYSPYGARIATGQAVFINASQRAIVANAPDGLTTNLHPALGYDTSYVNATDGAHQAGSALATGQSTHAVVWGGTAESMVDLHPPNFVGSGANGVRGNQQVGAAGNGPSSLPSSHAMVWNGTAQSAVDLHPAHLYPSPFSNSTAYGTDGTYQVGAVEYREFGVADIHHAALWNGTVASFIDLRPASGYLHSEAWAVAGSQQVGWGDPSDVVGNHALLWSGSAASVVDLHPGIDSQPGDPDRSVDDYSR